LKIKSLKEILAILLIGTILISPLTISYGESPNISAHSAIILDVETGRVLYEKNINDKKPMASTTKIMTALLALENSDLEEVIKVPKNAVGVEGSSIYLGYDEKIKMRDLVYGLMLRSGNDSAVAIAIHIGGTVEGFAEMMNKKAKEIGALNTNFTNPHGLHSKNHYTTAYDLALITREALKNETFKEIVKTKLYVADREGFKYFYNKNKTLAEFDGGDGVKTGYTMAAGRCLVASATRNDMQLLSVVLDAPNWFQDSYRLLDFSFEQYHGFKVIEKDKVIKKLSVYNGKKEYTGVVALTDVVIPLKDNEASKLNTIYELNESIKAPVRRGSKVGKAKIYLDEKLLNTVDLYSREDILEKDLKDKISDYIKNKFKNK